MTSVAKQVVSTTTYNGWSNRETWVMNLWLTNDELHYDTMQYVIKAYDEYEQAEQLESLVRDELESTVSPSLTYDLLVTSLGRISWQEIVENNR